MLLVVLFIISSDAAMFFELFVVYLPVVDGPVMVVTILSLRRPVPTFSTPLVKSSSAMSSRSMSENPSSEKLDLQAWASLVPNSSS